MNLFTPSRFSRFSCSSRSARTGTAVAATLLAGCAFIPPYERPQAPVAAAFPLPGAAGGTTAAEMPWTDFLPDARLRTLVDIALHNNRDLRAAVLNVEQTRALLGVQRADQLPSIGAGFNASRAPGANGKQASSYALGLSVSAFELDLFGRVKSLSAAALARYLASDEGRRSAQVALIATVANADLALRADEELLAVTQRTLASREEGLKLVHVKFDGGVSAEPELRATESLVAVARAGLIALQRQRQLDLNALVLLLGQPLPATLPVVQPLADTAFIAQAAALPHDPDQSAAWTGMTCFAGHRRRR